MFERMMMGLRMVRGVDERRFIRDFGCAPEDVWRQSLPRLMREGMIARQTGVFGLTARGMQVMNAVLVEMWKRRVTPSVATLSCRPSKREGWFSRYCYLTIKAPALRALSAKLTEGVNREVSKIHFHAPNLHGEVQMSWASLKRLDQRTGKVKFPEKSYGNGVDKSA